MPCHLFEQTSIAEYNRDEEPIFESLLPIAVEVRSRPNIRPRPETSLQIVLITQYCQLVQLFECDFLRDLIALKVRYSR